MSEEKSRRFAGDLAQQWRQSAKSFKNRRVLCVCGVLIALCCVLYAFSIELPLLGTTQKITFAYLAARLPKNLILFPVEWLLLCFLLQGLLPFLAKLSLCPPAQVRRLPFAHRKSGKKTDKETL